MYVDALARVADGARIGSGTKIGPFCVIGPDVVLGDDCELISHVTISGHTTIGCRTIIHPYASLGGAPQSFIYQSEPTRLVIGNDCVIRESVTINRGTAQGGAETRIGDGGYFMAYSHVAHDCIIGQKAIFANSATLAGHCVLGDRVFLSGLVSVHQFTRIGTGAMIAGGAHVRGDIIPFGLVADAIGRLIGINTIGMRRSSHTSETISEVKAAYRLIFFGADSLAKRIDLAEHEFGKIEAVSEIIRFLREPRQRPLCQPRVKRFEIDDLRTE